MRKALVIIMFVSVFALAKDVKTSVPTKLLSAKTVYIDNQSGYQTFADTVQKELANRFSFVSDSAGSDLVLRLTSKTDAGAYLYVTLTVLDENRVLWTNTKIWTRHGRNGPRDVSRDLLKFMRQ